MNSIGERPKCQKPTCRCKLTRPPDWVWARIENGIFRDVRELLAKPRSKFNRLLNPFHFHVLDTHRKQAVSRGYKLDDADSYKVLTQAAAFRECVTSVASKLSGDGKVAIMDVLRALLKGGDVVPEASFFESFISIAGQPLMDTPTRLEQFLTIRTAYANRDFDDIPSSIRPVNTSNFYVIDDYLSNKEELDNTYIAAKKHLGEGTEFNDTGKFRRRRGICTADTAPFLAAEHLQMYKMLQTQGQTRGYEQWLDDLARRPLGLAFLPLRVLGQYRAAGVWLYQGRFKENQELEKHLVSLTRTTDYNAEAWLAPAIGNAMLAAASLLLLRAVSEYKDVVRSSLCDCEIAERAVSNLWYAKEGACRWRGDTVVGSNQGKFDGMEKAKRTQAQRDQSSARIVLHIADQDDQKGLSSLLGFDTIGFDCPFVPRTSELDEEVERAISIFDDIGSPLLAMQERARR